MFSYNFNIKNVYGPLYITYSFPAIYISISTYFILNIHGLCMSYWKRVSCGVEW